MEEAVTEAGDDGIKLSISFTPGLVRKKENQVAEALGGEAQR
jgi:hypothetical protein